LHIAAVSTREVDEDFASDASAAHLKGILAGAPDISGTGVWSSLENVEHCMPRIAEGVAHFRDDVGRLAEKREIASGVRLVSARKVIVASCGTSVLHGRREVMGF